MLYKGLIFDLDGTAIPNRPDGMPSGELISAISKLRNSVVVSAATGRPWFNSKPIIRALGLQDPCIISGGTQIINPVEENILWEKDMSEDQVKAVMEVALSHPYRIFFSDDRVSAPAKEKVVKGAERIIYIEPVDKEVARIILEQLSKIPDIVAHPVISWEKDHFDIHITHSEATKEHAIAVWLDLVGLKKEETVGVGDSNNDIPLLQGVGYKVAMGNGTEEIKKIANEVVASVAENGLVQAIQRAFPV